jgi:hypothetical protein
MPLLPGVHDNSGPAVAYKRLARGVVREWP